MEKVTIIYPAVAMFLLTISLVFALGISRFFAIQRREVSIKFFQKYTEGVQPDRLHVWGRHAQNHFEIPPLFYIAVILLFVTDSVETLSVIAAWLFVGFRCIHSVIHLGNNNVSQRFLCFGLSLIALTVMWGSLFVQILKNS